jgi:hypothetical protein
LAGSDPILIRIKHFGVVKGLIIKYGFEKMLKFSKYPK